VFAKDKKKNSKSEIGGSHIMSVPSLKPTLYVSRKIKKIENINLEVHI